MVDVRGDVLRPPHGTTPAAVKSNLKSEMRSFKSNENIHKVYLDPTILCSIHKIHKSNIYLMHSFSKNSPSNSDVP